MKKISGKIKIVQAVLVAAVLTGVLLARNVTPASAFSGTIDLTSSSQSVTIGDQFVVTINATADSPFAIVQAKVNYDTSAVSVVGAVNFDGSPMDTKTPKYSETPGSYVISRFRVGPPIDAGKILIAKITFKAIKDSGTAGITGDKAGSLIYSPNESGMTTDILSAINGVNVALKPIPSTPSTPTTPSGGGTKPSGGTTTPSGGSTPTGGGATTSPGGTTTTPDAGGDSPSLDGLAVGTQPPTGSINDPAPAPEGGSPEQTGVDGLSITKYTKAITIGVTAAIALGAGAYLFWYLHRRNGLGFLNFHKSASGPTATGPTPVVFDATRPTNTPPTTPPSGIITPEHKDDK